MILVLEIKKCSKSSNCRNATADYMKYERREVVRERERKREREKERKKERGRERERDKER